VESPLKLMLKESGHSILMFLTKWHFEINVSGRFSEMPLMFVLKLMFLRKWAFLLDVIAISPLCYNEYTGGLSLSQAWEFIPRPGSVLQPP
jgi:hypothetical protein